MPRGYERIDSSGADHKDEHGIPLYPLRPEDGVSVSGNGGGSDGATVHVTVGGMSGPAASAPLYYGESAGLYTPISHNEIIERHDQPGMPVPQPLQHSAPAPAAPAPLPASTSVIINTTSGSSYPAQAYAQAYPQPTIAALPANPAVAPLQSVPLAAAVPQMTAPAQPMMYGAVPMQQPQPQVPPMVPMGMPQQMQLQQPMQPLVSVVPPVPQTLAQLRAMLDSRYVAFDTGRYLREGWAFTRQNFCFFLGAILGLGLLCIGAWLALYGTFVAAKWERPMHRHYESEDSEGMQYYWGFQWGTLIRELLYEVLIATPVTAGCIAAIFEAIRDNQYMRWRTLFSAFSCPYWARLAGLSLLLSVLTRVLLMLFVIPGVWFAIVSAFAVPFHLQFKHIPLRATHAIGLSIKTLHRNCCSYFGFVIACVLLNLLGFLLLGVGLFVTVPVTVAASAYCYHHLVGLNGAAVLVPIETARAYQQQAAAMQQQQLVQQQPMQLQMQPQVALPVALPVPLQQQPQQPQVVVVVSPHNSAH